MAKPAPAHSPDVSVLASSPGSPGKRAPANLSEVWGIFDAHAPFVMRSLRYLGVAASDVSDASQEVFLVVHRKHAGFEGRSSLRTWLYGICIRVASTFRRRSSRRSEVPARDASASEEVAEPTSIAPPEERGEVLALLDMLDEDKRAVLVLHAIEGLTMEEVADALQIPLGTGYSRLRAAKKQLAAQLETERGR